MDFDSTHKTYDDWPKSITGLAEKINRMKTSKEDLQGLIERDLAGQTRLSKQITI